MNVSSFLFLIGGGVLFTLGDVLLKKWSLANENMYYICGILLYIVGIVLFSMTLREKNLAVANTILVTSNIVFLAIVSAVFFRESLSLTQMAGLGFSLLAVVLLELGA